MYLIITCYYFSKIHLDIAPRSGLQWLEQALTECHMTPVGAFSNANYTLSNDHTQNPETIFSDTSNTVARYYGRGDKDKLFDLLQA